MSQRLIRFSYSCDIRSFLTSLEDEDLHDIVRTATSELVSAEARTRRAPQCGDYARLLRGFLFFLQHQQMPDDISSEEFLMFRYVCDRLVQKQQLKPAIMQLFAHP